MTFASRETSRSVGSPITLYRFSYQTNVYAYNDTEDEIIVIGEPAPYLPIPISRDAVTSSGTLDRSVLKIEVPHTTAIAELFRVFPPSDVVGLVIYQGHGGEDEFLAIWSGRVISAGRTGSKASMMCEPVSTSMKRPGLRRRYQYGCPHALYGPKCRADRPSHTVSAVVQSVGGATVTFGAGWNGSFPETRFLDGLLEWTAAGGTTELRTILRVDTAANRLTIAGRIASLQPGMSVALSLGCDHQEDGCNVFGNILNFGGCLWIPKKNPIGFVNQFY